MEELDYYLYGVGSVLVEEFALGSDHTTVGLRSALWTNGGWRSAASFSRYLRTDPATLAELTPTDRAGAQAALRNGRSPGGEPVGQGALRKAGPHGAELAGRGALGNGRPHGEPAGAGGPELPDEAALRLKFVDYEVFASAPPLRLGPAEPPEGFHEKRLYRVLFAKDLRVSLPAGSREVGDDHFSWTLRRVGNGIAWGLDVTALLRTGADRTVREMLRELTRTVRKQGLIPVVTERFA
jgi:hypothetical protein